MAIGAGIGAGLGALQGGLAGYAETGSWQGAWSGIKSGALMGSLMGGGLGLSNSFVCFVAGTQVVTGLKVKEAGGSLRALTAKQLLKEHGHGEPITTALRVVGYLTTNIEELKEGDYVLSRDQHDPDGPLVAGRISRKYKRIADHLQIVGVKDTTDRTQILQTTDEHPFHVVGKGWTASRLLAVGDGLFGSGEAGSAVTSNARESRPGGVAVYNMEIEGSHSYFVRAEGAEGKPVWVHNSCAVETEEGYELQLALKEGWSAEQIAQARAKVASLHAAAERGELVRSVPKRGSTTARSMYEDAGFDVADEMDVDHVIDLQLGGLDAVKNTSPLNFSVNRSLGSQIYHATKTLEIGTRITGVKFV